MYYDARFDYTDYFLSIDGIINKKVDFFIISGLGGFTVFNLYFVNCNAF